jgi:hypothetical protein
LAGLTTAALGHNVTEPGRLAAERRFTAEVLQDAVARGERLTDEEIARRALARRKLFYARLSFASAKARAERARARRFGPFLEGDTDDELRAQ